MTKPIRFKGLTDTTANLNTDRFQGRIAFDTTKQRSVVCTDGTEWAENARRDLLETFAQGIALGNLTQYRVVIVGSGGVLMDDASLTYGVGGLATSRDIAVLSRKISVGTTGNAGGLIFNRGSDGADTGYIGFGAATGLDEQFKYQTAVSGQYHSWHTHNGTAIAERMRLHSSGGLSVGVTSDPGVGNINTPYGAFRSYTGATGYGGVYPAGVTPGNDNWAVLWEGGNAFTFLNATNAVNLQNTSGAVRTTILSASAAGVTIPGLSSASVRPLVASTAGLVQAQDAATFRGTIGVEAATTKWRDSGRDGSSFSGGGNSFLSASATKRKFAANTWAAGDLFEFEYRGIINIGAKSLTFEWWLTPNDGTFSGTYYVVPPNTSSLALGSGDHYITLSVKIECISTGATGAFRYWNKVRISGTSYASEAEGEYAQYTSGQVTTTDTTVDTFFDWMCFGLNTGDIMRGIMSEGKLSKTV